MPSNLDAGKRVAIVQSNYIPWKGYFDLIGRVDEFVLFDDTQFTRRDWRNRNRIKVAGGAAWLTIPVQVKGRFTQPIFETQISDRKWASKHWKSICHWYARAKYFNHYRELFEELYLGCEESTLSRINYRFLRAICQVLGIPTVFSWSMDYPGKEGKTERLVEICRRVGATRYLSGPSAKSYIEDRLFEEAGIELVWMDYSGYSPYGQLFPPFLHEVSILDLLFCEGPGARRYMKCPLSANPGAKPPPKEENA